MYSSSSSSSFGNKKRSLLGYDDPDASAMVKSTQEQLKSQNEAKVSFAPASVVVSFRFFLFFLFVCLFFFKTLSDWPAVGRNSDVEEGSRGD
jgi:hypothetical protein